MTSTRWKYRSSAIGALMAVSAYTNPYLRNYGLQVKTNHADVGSAVSRYWQALVHNLSSFKLVNFCLLMFFVLFNLVKWTLFGKLSDNEVSHLRDKISYTIWEFWFGFLIFLREANQIQTLDPLNTVVRHEFVKYSGFFLCIVLLKSFHVICAERAYTLSNQSHPTSTDLVQYRRLGYGVLMINFIDILLICSFFHQMYYTYCGNSILRFKDNILVAIFGFEILHSFPLVFFTGIKYTLDYYGKITFFDSESNTLTNYADWQVKKAKIISLVEFSVNLIRFGMSCTFAILFLYFYTFPFHILPSSYLSLRLLIVKARCLISLERRNIKLKKLNLPTTIDPTARCIICFDNLNSSSVDGVRCLNSCEHNFHYSCLKSWLECSDNCPVCRTKI
ncbi:hypothetical protein CANTEDRAFT_116726 [Yamadazyma tenuis ATCC 10573]|uniref:RING-type domain-containing protein n=1 Tax=Candida tenuis (strain ATCC 10573 / BCRC 21748 / CBS 615 / JCM 9827 / NBRC 10315 / NRRL Y-1498 / VKM Y-70) TaxID=590646 RepID=G3BFE6_CANTC|nr:uncharacterized protein CANTEDRAFT_116726 [Yamadazyma tenuis ATCC 10573]EGV60669.1 hypothetical protein CANTEDRAFT_116726 [Yamadazyma tenuis ATCC 10573]